MKFSPVFKALAVVSMLATAAATAQAASDDDAIELRKTAMKGIGASMGGLKMVVQGKAGTDMAKGFADAMAAYASVTGGLFPKGSDFGDTRAKEEIWTKADEFKAALMAFEQAAQGMAKAAASGDAGAIKGAFGGLGKSCGGCHKPFRKPKS
jgi:cytochrome c556